MFTSPHFALQLETENMFEQQWMKKKKNKNKYNKSQCEKFLDFPRGKTKNGKNEMQMQWQYQRERLRIIQRPGYTP